MLHMNQIDQIKEFQKEEYAEEYQCSYALVQRYVKQYKEAKRGRAIDNGINIVT